MTNYTQRLERYLNNPSVTINESVYFKGQRQISNAVVIHKYD